MSTTSHPTLAATSALPSQTQPQNPSNQQQLFNSSSLVFGFIFLAIIIVVLGSGCLWQRYMQTRRGGVFVGGIVVGGVNGRTRRGINVEKERPVLYDVFLGKRNEEESVEQGVEKGKGKSEDLAGAGLNVQDGRWLGMKPLSIQLLSPKLDEHSDSSNPSHEPPLPLWQEHMNRILPFRPSARTPLHPQQPTSNTSQPRARFPSLIPSRWRRSVQTAPPSSQPGTSSNIISSNSEKPEATSHTESHAPGDAPSATRTEIQLAVVIAMPSPSRPFAASRQLDDASGSSSSVEETNAESKPRLETRPPKHPLHSTSLYLSSGYDDPVEEDLVYELGVASTSLYADPRLCGFGSDNGAEKERIGKLLGNGSEADGHRSAGS